MISRTYLTITGPELRKKCRIFTSGVELFEFIHFNNKMIHTSFQTWEEKLIYYIIINLYRVTLLNILALILILNYA